MKSITTRLISSKEEIEEFESRLIGSQIHYKGDYAVIKLVDFQAQSLVLILKNADGESREETVSFKEYAGYKLEALQWKGVARYEF